MNVLGFMTKQPRGPGRPSLFREKVQTSIALDRKEYDAFRRLGDGNFSRGVREALRLATEARKSGKEGG